MENYLQCAWGDAMDNIGIDEVKNAITELQEMDDEHGAFWVSVFEEEETILEIDKNMKMVAIFNGDVENPVVKQLKTWAEVLFFYELLLNNDFESLRTRMEQ
ncbi:hypothetical protein [Pedobacter heparinus]|uniref:hypothetical protein n=1 Tax=Pedobacter heparinus TaxID=984 RepID=UPI00292FD851|nr:hypothetical protein [Pedobacter heparinus]